MMKKQHTYALTINWTGNTGQGTSGYRSYARQHVIRAANKPDIEASSDPAFLGDPSRYNPEELLVASLSSCHMLWYLHLCATAGVIVTDYTDTPTGTMVETDDGSGHFSQVTLSPVVTVAEAAMIDKANELHAEANRFCFIANSCNFPVHHHPRCRVAS